MPRMGAYRAIQLLALVLAIALGTGLRAEGVRMIEIHETIGPATSNFFARHLEKAQADGIELLIIQLDTPGGLLESTRDIITQILASSIPVVTWIAPQGARAASAGVYISYASHIVAMTNATNLGSATPVMMQVAVPAIPVKPAEDSGKQGEDSDATEADGDGEADANKEALERKILNDSIAYIKGLATLRGRNVEWAEEAVRDAANLPAKEALAAGVIDYIATDLDSLLEQAQGRVVKVGPTEREVTIDLKSRDAEDVEIVKPDWRHQFISIITNPTVISILLLFGIYGLIAEFYNPGTGIGGITGVLCLLVTFFALQVLPVNYVGLALIMVGIGLIVIESITPGFGLFAIGGAISFVLGAIFLIDTDVPLYQVSIPIIVGLAAGMALISTLVLGMAEKARRRPVVTGVEAMIGDYGKVVADFGPNGQGLVMAQGETWQAKSTMPMRTGDRVRITNVQGLMLDVQPDLFENKEP